MISPASAGGNTPPRKPASYLSEAVAIAESVGADVESDAIGEWQCVFTIAREVRSLMAPPQLSPMKFAVHIWNNSAHVNGSYDEDDFCTQFVRSWKKVRTMLGENMLQSAVLMSQQTPLGLKPEDVADTTKGFQRFISFCGWLCVAAGTDQIKLPCREVGAALGANKLTVSGYREEAVERGYLIKLKDHVFRAGGKGEATLFRFRVGWWDVISQKVKASD